MDTKKKKEENKVSFQKGKLIVIFVYIHPYKHSHAHTHIYYIIYLSVCRSIYLSTYLLSSTYTNILPQNMNQRAELFYNVLFNVICLST